MPYLIILVAVALLVDADAQTDLKPPPIGETAIKQQVAYLVFAQRSNRAKIAIQGRREQVDQAQLHKRRDSLRKKLAEFETRSGGEQLCRPGNPGLQLRESRAIEGELRQLFFSLTYGDPRQKQPSGKGERKQNLGFDLTLTFNRGPW